MQSVKMFLLQHLLLILMIPLSRSSTTTDTMITPNKPLRDGELLLSKQSKFALGFFSPQNSTLRYIGVWYYTIPEQTVVWVLNRNHPVNDTSGVLSIHTCGNLLLHRGNTTTTHVWSTNLSISSVNANATVAQLLDTGNLVLMIQNDDKMVVWQGFDYPTDTQIPYMKIGLDRKTGFNRFLTSWKSQTDPGTGTYSCGFNTSGSPQAFLYQGSQRLWRSGHWNGVRFSGVPAMIYTVIFTSMFLNNQDGISSMFTAVNASVLTRMTLDHNGYLQRSTWLESQGKWSIFFTVPRDLCDRYGWCGPNSNCDDMGPEFECTCLPGFEPKSARDWFLKDGSAGCLRKEGAKVCGSGEGFVKVEATKPPDTSAARVNMNMSLEACREECLKECSCSAYATANVSGSGSGCLSWYGDLMDIRKLPEGGQDLYVRVDAITLGIFANI